MSSFFQGYTGRYGIRTAAGRVDVSSGVIEATDVVAGIGKTSIRKGNLSLGLGPGDQPLHMDMDLDADLGQLPAVLEKLIPDTDFMAQFRFQPTRVHLDSDDGQRLHFREQSE